MLYFSFVSCKITSSLGSHHSRASGSSIWDCSRQQWGEGGPRLFCSALLSPISCPACCLWARTTTLPLTLSSSPMGWISQPLQLCQDPPTILLQRVTCPPDLNAPSWPSYTGPALIPHPDHFPLSCPPGKHLLVFQGSVHIQLPLRLPADVGVPSARAHTLHHPSGSQAVPVRVRSPL